MADLTSDTSQDARKKGAKHNSVQDNLIRGFQLESSALRGRMVRLGSVLDDLLEAHNYPKPVAHMVGETAVLALLLSTMLKYDGIFTLQTNSDGPLSMLVADVTSNGDLRAYAHYDEDRLQKAREQLVALKTVESSQNQLAQYLGKGYIAFTVDQGSHTDRYQGIVDLKGASLVDCVQHYFQQSEQIGTGIKMSVGERDGKWRAGGIMLQHLPEEERIKGNIDEDDWRRSMILMDTTTDDEFLDVGLDENELLMRLFHEEGVRVYEPISVQQKCRCSEERVKNVLSTLNVDDLSHITKGKNIEVKCEFCSKEYAFEAKMFKPPKDKTQT